MADDNPALNKDGSYKDASDMQWYNSEGDEAPMPKGGVPAPPPPSGENLSDDEASAPGKISASLPRRPRDQPNPELILEGSRNRKRAPRAVEAESGDAVNSRYVRCHVSHRSLQALTDVSVLRRQTRTPSHL